MAAMRHSIYDEFARLASLRVPRRVTWRMWTDSEFNDYLAECDARITALESSGDPADQQQNLSEVFLQRAYALEGAGRSQEAIAAYAQVADRFADPRDDAVRRDVVRALQQHAYLLGNADRHAEAQISLDRAQQVGGDLARPSLREMRAAVQRASELEEKRRYGEVVELLGDVIRPWGNEPPPEAAELVAYAMVLCVRAGARAGPNTDSALQACDEVFAHFSLSDDPRVRAMVVWSLTTKAWVFATAQQYDRAVDACMRAIEYAGDDDHPNIRERRDDAIQQRARWRRAQRSDEH